MLHKGNGKLNFLPTASLNMIGFLEVASAAFICSRTARSSSIFSTVPNVSSTLDVSGGGEGGGRRLGCGSVDIGIGTRAGAGAGTGVDAGVGAETGAWVKA